MPEQILDYALTTVARIKNRLTITVSTYDTVIQRLINAITDFIEGECDRRFKQTTYTSEVYSFPETGKRPIYLVLKQAPVSALTALQYRAGLFETPSWTDFNRDDYELMEDGESGIVRVWGILRQVDSVRATYTAGYKIDFNNAGDNSNHTLPHDISDLVERLVIEKFKKREDEGKSSKSFSNGSVNWRSKLSEEDRAVINRYKRVPFI